MSKSSTATAPKNPTQLPARSAWAKGPPQTATAPSPRSQSPAPSTPVHQTHSRRPSALGQGIPIKDGVSVPRSNIGSVKQSSAVTFGSIDDVSAPISSSPAAAPALKSEGVKSFGTVPAANPAPGHVNGKASISSRAPALPPTPSTSSAASSPTVSAALPITKPKIDIKKMFQIPSTAAPTNQPSETSSPSMRNSPLPSQASSSHPQQSHPPTSQLAHNFTTFVPGGSMRQPQNNGPNGGPPRSPQYSRQMPNGSGPRQGGQNGGPAGLSSPRLAPHPHPPQPSPMGPPPPMQPQMQSPMHQHMPMAWGGYYQYPNPAEQPHYQMYQQWYQPPPMPMQPPHGQPPHTGPHMGPPMPMSPRNPPSSLQGPGTPISHTHTLPPVHPSHPPPAISHASTSMGGLTSPPPTPSSASIPRLNAGSSAFVPRAKVTLKKEDGTEVNLENFAAKSIPAPVPSTTASPSPQGSVYRQGSPGTPNRRPTSVRIESEDQRKRRLAEEQQKEKEAARVKAEAEEKVRKEKEEAELKVKEAEEKKWKEEEAEKERIRKEEEAKRLKLEEEERLRKEEEEREAQRLREEEERKRKEEEEEARRVAEEKAKKEEEERLEKERIEKEKAEQEAKEAEAERLRIEQEAAKKEAEAAATPEPASESSKEATEDGEVVEDKVAEGPAPADAKEKLKDGLRINTNPVPISPSFDRKRPGPLDLTGAKTISAAGAATPGPLATARIIADINTVQYPEGVRSPHPELNQNAKEGKFRYDREFLLQFMSICKEKPAMLPPLDAIGLEPTDQHHMARGGSGRKGSGAIPPQRQGSIGLGFSSNTFGGKGAGNPFGGMGNFATPGASKLNSEERFATSTRAASVSGAPGMQFSGGRPTPMTRTASQGGPGAPLRDRTRSKRGEKRDDKSKAPGGGQQSYGRNDYNNQQALNLEPVAPLQATANRWDRKAIVVDAESPEMVDRKVKGLLNKLTMEKFDSISDQIIAWANKSEKEKDGRTLIQVIRLVFEKATDEATWSEMYARLCRKMMEQISPKVQDDGIKNNEGKPIAGGQLFRKYLLNRCQEDFERGWVAKETTAAAAVAKAADDQAVKAANAKTKEDGKEDEAALYSEEYYAAQKAKRQGLGLIKFIGELFKLQMLTERIMHECVKKLLGNVDNPEEEEIESLCKLLTTVGGILDTPKARAHLDVYFSRMKELTKSPNVNSRMQYMLLDLIELRERKWVSRTSVAAPTTIAQIHEAAAKEKAAAEKESYQRQISMSRGGSRRGGDRGEYPQVGPDGWAVAGGGSGPARPPPKAGDLSNFGKISKGSAPMTFGPSSVFAGKKESKRESISRTSSSSNMFSMLSSQAAESAEAAPKAPAEPVQRKRLVLQPRSKPVESENAESQSPVAGSDAGASEEEAQPEPEAMSDEVAKKKIAEDTKEFFAVRNLQEAEVYFTALPAVHHHKLVDSFVSKAVESKEADAQLVADFFAQSTDKCSAAAFEEGFSGLAEFIEDIAIDAPKAVQLFVLMIKGAKLDEEAKARLAAKSSDSDKLLALLQ
ncbi:hypothetical protein BDN70DRAFT_870471 [Pholiota conissans]|uniref:MI domain-containing protein n=1 Tax=Pholiota conissans TaxID=109636 RepID=A0A9P5ZEK0_9AGAR|nr:hypothetical protein BDN70DRAFT_870471 [Pholiota conissans]